MYIWVSSVGEDRRVGEVTILIRIAIVIKFCHFITAIWIQRSLAPLICSANSSRILIGRYQCGQMWLTANQIRNKLDIRLIQCDNDALNSTWRTPSNDLRSQSFISVHCPIAFIAWNHQISQLTNAFFALPEKEFQSEQMFIAIALKKRLINLHFDDAEMKIERKLISNPPSPMYLWHFKLKHPHTIVQIEWKEKNVFCRNVRNKVVR